MENSGILCDSYIYVCSRNPIAIWAIGNMLHQKSLNYRTSQLVVAPLSIASSKTHIAVFDVSSIPEWPELIPKWTMSGYKPIILVNEHWGFGGAQTRALHLGAAGIVHVTNEFGKQFMDALTVVASGQVFAMEVFLGNRQSEFRVQGACADARRLSFREGQVLDLLMLGFSNRRIGTVLGISERTSKFHVCNILRKLHMRSRRELRGVDRNTLNKEELPDTSRIVVPVTLSE